MMDNCMRLMIHHQSSILDQEQLNWEVFEKQFVNRVRQFKIN